jgi:dethiobiotin synthetase
MTPLFVTGAGTEVGKTYVLEALVGELGAAGIPLRVLKPVASGFDPAAAAESDTGRLLAAQGLPLTEQNIERASPWRFAAPLSPDMAAEREGRRVPFDDLLAFCRADEPGALTLIEGIGGVMVPLDERHTVLDWIAALQAKALLVTGSYLGALSHTLTAVQALRGAGLTVAAVVVSESAAASVALDATAETLERFVAPIPVVSWARERGGEGPPRRPPLAPVLGLTS